MIMTITGNSVALLCLTLKVPSLSTQLVTVGFITLRESFSPNYPMGFTGAEFLGMKSELAAK